MREIAVVAIGGAVGAALRYALGGWLTGRLGSAYPLHTLVINLSGTFLLGLLMSVSLERGLVGPTWRLFLGIGVLGSFTTFSTLSYESIRLIEQGELAWGIANMFGSGLMGLMAAVGGLILGRVL